MTASEPRRTPGAAAIQFMEAQAPWAVFAEGAALIAVLALVDQITGSEVGFSIFYLGPVALVTWCAGRLWGMAAATLAALTWLGMDLAAGATYSHPAIPIWNMVVRLGFFLVTVILLDEVHRSHDHERELSRTDGLTACSNARQFYERGALELHRQRRTGRALTVVYIDLDNFKSVNDSMGHSCGDELLRTVATTLQGATRATDLVARLGGDEFGILLADLDADGAKVVVDKVHKAVNDTVICSELPVSASIGAVTFVDPAPGVDEMVQEADTLMYEAKRAGKARALHATWRAS